MSEATDTCWLLLPDTEAVREQLDERCKPEFHARTRLDAVLLEVDRWRKVYGQAPFPFDTYKLVNYRRTGEVDERGAERLEFIRAYPSTDYFTDLLS